MKKIFTIVFGLSFAGLAGAQSNEITTGTLFASINNEKAAGDTIIIPTAGAANCTWDSTVMFNSLVGTASYQGLATITAVAQKYNTTHKSKILGVVAFYLPLGTTVPNAPGFAVSLAGAGANPTNALGTNAILGLAQPAGLLNTGDTLYQGLWAFAVPVDVDAEFYVKLSTTTSTATDSILWGLKNCTGQALYAQAGTTWMGLGTNFPNDLLLNVLAVEGQSTVSINENPVVSVGLMPNPASDFTSVVYNVTEVSKVDVKIINIAGQVVKQISEGSKQPGTYVTPLDVKDLANGTYIYQVSANGHVATGRLVVAK